MKSSLLDTGLIVPLLDRDSGQILTLDSDFEIYRWRSRRKFDLLVEV